VLGVQASGFHGTLESARQFAELTGVTFPLFLDDGSFDEWDWAAGVAPFPRQVLLDRDGRVAYIASEHDAAALIAAIEAVIAEP
jgi:peroxiredoxin